MDFRTRRSADAGDLRTHAVEGVAPGGGPLRSGVDLSVVQPGGSVLVRAPHISTDGDLLLAIDLSDGDVRDLLVRLLSNPQRREGTLAAIGAAVGVTASGEAEESPSDVLAAAGGNRTPESPLGRMLRTHLPT